MSRKKVIVKQIRSATGRDKRTKSTLAALGLGRIGFEKEHEITPSTAGMLHAIKHLVIIHEQGKQPAGKYPTRGSKSAAQGKQS